MSAPETPVVTPGQAAYEARQAAKARRMGAPDSEPDSALVAIIGLRWEELPAGMRADEEAAARAAIAARQPQPAPACPDPSQHRDVYGRPLPQAEAQPAPGLAELIRDWRESIAELEAGPVDRASTVEVETLRTVIRQVERAAPAPGLAAPELAAAMAESRLARERLDAIRTCCEAKTRQAGMVDGKSVARKVIAIIDKPEGK